MPKDLGAKPSYRNNGFSQISRRQDLCSRSISGPRPSPASRSSPSVMNSTTAPWASTRRDQRRLEMAGHWPLGGAAAHASTTPPALSGASAELRERRNRGDVPVPGPDREV